MPDSQIITHEGDEFVVNSTVKGDQGYARVARLESGGFVVVWEDRSGEADILAQIYDASGARLGGQFRVNSLTKGYQYLPDVSGLAGGGFVVTWLGNVADYEFVARAQVFRASGAMVGSEFTAATRVGYGRPADVTSLAGGGFVVVDHAGGGQAFDSYGAKTGSFTVGRPSLQGGATTAALADGRVLVAVAERDGGMILRFLDRGGAPTGAEIRVPRASVKDGYPALAALHDGGFVVGWSMYDSTQSYDVPMGDAVAQMFDAAGNKVGGEIRLNASTAGNQYDISFAGVPGGGFVAMWTDYDPPSGVGRPRGQLFDAAGARLDAEFGVSDSLRYVRASLALIGGDRLVATWTGPDGPTRYWPDDFGVRAQIFALSAGSVDGVGSAENDRLDAATETVVLSGRGGDDILYWGGLLDQQDRSIGGDGTDTVVLQGNYPALRLGEASLSGIEGLSLQSGTIARWGQSGTNSFDYALTMHQANVAPGQMLRVNAQSLTTGEDFTFDGSAETDGGGFLIYAGHGVDRLRGGSGNDLFVFAGGRFGAGDTVDGGGGADGVVITGASPGSTGPVTVAIAAGTFTSVDALSFNSRYAEDPAARPSYEVTLADGNVHAFGRLIVNGSSLEAGQSLRFDGSAATTGTLVIYGGAGGDTLTGGAGNDRILGGASGDTLRGGGGGDRFDYLSVSDSSGAASDLIADFELGSDKINLTLIDADVAASGDQAFIFIDGAAFSGKAGELRVFHDDAAGWWTVLGDVDGDGQADFQLFVATGGPAPAASDFLL